MIMLPRQYAGQAAKRGFVKVMLSASHLSMMAGHINTAQAATKVQARSMMVRLVARTLCRVAPVARQQAHLAVTQVSGSRAPRHASISLAASTAPVISLRSMARCTRL